MKSYISKIRELINKRILSSLLLRDQKKWNFLCGSLDAIESTQLAVDSYNGLKKDNCKDIGLVRLIAYGLFQALYVQQDSVRNLCESIDIPMPKKEDDFKAEYPELHEVRQLRNKGIGHPSKDGGSNTHNMLIEGDSINLYSYTEAGEFSFATYKISDCIEKQNESLCKIIQRVIEEIKSMEQKHKDRFMHSRLIGCFPADPEYCIGKVFEAINLIEAEGEEESLPQKEGRKSRIHLALTHADTLTKAIDKFESEFAERGLQDVYVSQEIEHSKYPLEKLKEYFSPTSENSINAQDARAYADSAEKHMLDLVTHAQNLDNEYSSPT